MRLALTVNMAAQAYSGAEVALQLEHVWPASPFLTLCDSRWSFIVGSKGA